MVSVERMPVVMRSTCCVRENLYLPEGRQGPVQFGRHLISYFHKMWTERVMRSTDKFALFSLSVCTMTESDVDI
ncbi:hypothetical protein P8452_21931 [Trifolium repens]|nr:hypothetical protein P8452_21931 [Trifolium repens]